jgi:two-component system OmpR family response regulator
LPARKRLISFSLRYVTTCNNQAASLDFRAGFRSVTLMSKVTDALIVIVEDDEEIHRLVRDMLLREGFSVEVAADGEALDHLLTLQRPDLVILDLMLPGEDGLSICRRLRSRGGVPIMILTAKADAIDRVVGLEMGADDYLPKPFNPRELLARVRALLRRSRGMVEVEANRRHAFVGLVMDLDARQLCTEAGEVISLTAAEFELLACFVQRPRRVLTRDQLLDWTRGRVADPFDRSIDMTISRLRKKIDAVVPGLELISTVRNNGYLFVAAVKQLSA